jgi:hypothetical protein
MSDCSQRLIGVRAPSLTSDVLAGQTVIFTDKIFFIEDIDFSE